MQSSQAHGKGTLTCRKVVRAARPSRREVFWSVTGNGTNGGAGGTWYIGLCWTVVSFMQFLSEVSHVSVGPFGIQWNKLQTNGAPQKNEMRDWGYVTSFFVEWSYFTLLIASFSGPTESCNSQLIPRKTSDDLGKTRLSRIFFCLGKDVHLNRLHRNGNGRNPANQLISI